MELLSVHVHGGHVCASENRKLRTMKLRKKKLRDSNLEGSFIFSPLIKII
jgi:hypothetical protein